MEVTEGNVSEEQGGFRKGRGCVDQIFAMKRLVEEYLIKDKSCMQLLWILRSHMIGLTEKLSSVLKIYGVGGQLSKGIQAFYREANACVRVGGKWSECVRKDINVLGYRKIWHKIGRCG